MGIKQKKKKENTSVLNIGVSLSIKRAVRFIDVVLEIHERCNVHGKKNERSHVRFYYQGLHALDRENQNRKGVDLKIDAWMLQGLACHVLASR